MISEASPVACLLSWKASAPVFPYQDPELLSCWREGEQLAKAGVITSPEQASPQANFLPVSTGFLALASLVMQQCDFSGLAYERQNFSWPTSLTLPGHLYKLLLTYLSIY